MRNSQDSRTFSLPDPRWVGDGKSKDTAIFFPHAKSQLEHIMMQHAFVRASGIEVVGIRYSPAEADEGYVYDVWPTAQGKLWFKVVVSPTDNFTQELMEAKSNQAAWERWSANCASRIRELLAGKSDRR